MWILNQFFILIGLLTVLDYLLNFYKFFRSLSFRSPLKPENSWAVITGSTDGIGEGFAHALAAKGFNIVQVSRNQLKLEKTAADLRSKFGIQVKNIQKDFSKCTENPFIFFSDIFEQCKNLEVSLLVNNVGTSYSNTLFSDVSSNKLQEVLALNIFPTVFLSLLFMPLLANRAKKGQNAGIINLSSVLGNVCYERYLGYCAVKAFVKTFSEFADVDNRLMKNKVLTLCLQPGYVLTPLTSGTKGKFLVIDRSVCAENALRLIGYQVVSHGYWKHFISGLIYKSVNYKTFMLIKKLNS
jgi:17beta-estradiol 17-dehydrogenase / very-long-chain 3-oxoacyl-CoA reductase